jgi:hypothetical protein
MPVHRPAKNHPWSGWAGIDVEKPWYVFVRRGSRWKLAGTSTTRDAAERFLAAVLRGGEVAGVVVPRGGNPAQQGG